MCFLRRREVSLQQRAFGHSGRRALFGVPRRRVYHGRHALQGNPVPLSQVPSLASRSNSALLTDTYASPLRAQCGAAERER
jgi:hypothetical protein